MGRVFVLGAGFSKAAKMPLANELIDLLRPRFPNGEMHDWLDGLKERLAWLSGNSAAPFRLNIEQVFHFANFDSMVWRLKQHNCPVGRGSGETPWQIAEDIETWLTYLENALHDVIFESDENADLSPIVRWAETIEDGDSVLTFNYDTLVERALAAAGKSWHHGFARQATTGVGVYKLHGSIDWIVAERRDQLSHCSCLYDKENRNSNGQETGHVEDDCRLWHCHQRERLRRWIENRDLGSDTWRAVGIAGLGSYKRLDEIPGLGRVWINGMSRLHKARSAVVIGFSLSDFDAMAQMQFGTIAMDRHESNIPLPVTIVDPFADQDLERRFIKVFRRIASPVRKPHEEVEWEALYQRGA